MAGELASLIKPQVRGNNTREGRNFDFDFFFFNIGIIFLVHYSDSE